jgi:MinD-like ATPase involved in chromosome partitioning or flagellar assembly
MDDLARVRFDQSSVAQPRASSLSRLTVLGAGRWHAPLGGRPGARFIAVRGRGGAGKSTVAANLAIAMAGLRSRVVLLDLDFRNPSQHQLFGITAPVSGLKALLHEQIDTIEQALTPTTVRNLYLVSAEGTSSTSGSAKVEQQHRLLNQIWELDADVVIADVGTDADEVEFVDFFELGALRLVVSAADPRSIRRAYNCFKEPVVREIEHVVGGTAEGARLLAALASPDARPMNELLGALANKPNARAALEQALSAFGGRLVGNRARNSDEADLIHAASRLIAEYLGIAVPVLGVVESSVQVDATRISGRPLLLGSGIDRNVRLFHSMAEQLLMDAMETEAPRCVARPPLPPGMAISASSPLSEDADGPPLPASLGSYMRRHPRHPVDWHALFRSASGRETPVRVFEVSLSGASIEALPGLDVGDHGRLVFPQIADRPRVAVTVLDARRPLGRAGLRFDDSKSSEAVRTRLAALAADQGKKD